MREESTMKKTTAAIALLLAFSANANEAIQNTEIENLTQVSEGQHIVYSTKGHSDIGGGLFAETRAKARAKSNAKDLADQAANEICSEGVISQTHLNTQGCFVQDGTATCEVKSTVVCITPEIEDTELSLKVDLGKMAPSSACAEKLTKKFSVDAQTIDHCNKISSPLQYKCLELVSDYSTIKTLSISACAGFETEESLNVLNAYAGNTENNGRYGVPSALTTFVFSTVDTEEEEVCVLNKLRAGSISADDLEKSCITDTKEELDAKELEAFGFITVPRTIQGHRDSFVDTVRGLWDSIVN
jgi:hypothetical protein